MNLVFNIGYLVIGPLMLLISFIFAKYPPKKINEIYGYRTMRSMFNQECWYFAKRHSIRLIWKIFLTTSIIQAAGIILLDEEVVFLTATIVLVTTLIYSVYLTEKALKKKFDKEGSRI